MKSDEWVLIDTETTGLTQPIYAVEIAAQRMKGWHPEGPPFQVLLNHDVPIESRAEELHGYSREYLKEHGEDPLLAHEAFHDYCGTLPVVAYNISFDWHRVLLPEYERLGVPQTGVKSFCALNLARRAITETKDLTLPTLKEHFELSKGESHHALDDVQSLVALFGQVLRKRLEPIGVSSLEELSEYSKVPMSECMKRPPTVRVEKDVWHIATEDEEYAGPFSATRVRELAKGEDCYLWRDGMPDWELASRIPDFADTITVDTPKRKKKAKIKVVRKITKFPDKNGSVAEVRAAVSQLCGLCKGILADGIISEEELMLLYEWIESCSCTHVHPMSLIADTLEKICEDDVVTRQEQAELASIMNEVISTHA